jgi:imidazolonepropionase-like amidohydrolase
LVTGPDDVSICMSCAELAVEVFAEDVTPPEPDVVLTGISTLATMDHRRGGVLGAEHDVAVVVRRGRVVWLGTHRDMPGAYAGLPEMACEGRAVVPGMVDAAVSVLGGPVAGGRDPSDLADEGAAALRAMVDRGVTAVDLRVGGGLDPVLETMSLAVARSLGERAAARVSVSWRCSDGHTPYQLKAVMAPTAARLARFVVVECTGDEGRLGETLSAMEPLRARIVCREPEPVACLPHLARAVSVEGVPAHCLAPEGPPPVVPWWEPGAARSAWAVGARPALASFSDPASRLLAGMGVVLMAAIDLAGLGFEQALWSVTRGGALAGGDPDRGWIRLGGPADLVVIDGDRPEDLVRRPDGEPAWGVLVGGVEIR